ncbi:unnamed protein product [Ilex paraguariensis]|uniref:Uncharacterized protein n=1 Tax=Ilex paraguariensis TaxID=185542 RepID=A0ABC8TEY1_9AQUA
MRSANEVEMVGTDDIGVSNGVIQNSNENVRTQPEKKNKRKRIDSRVEDIKKTLTSFLSGSSQVLGDMAKHMGYAHDVADKRARVYGILEQIEGLNFFDRIRAGQMFVNDQKRVDYFFSLPDIEKPYWLQMLLNGKL